MDSSNAWYMVVDVQREPTRISAPRRAFTNNLYRDMRKAPNGEYYALRREIGVGGRGYEVWLNWAASLKP